MHGSAFLAASTGVISCTDAQKICSKEPASLQLCRLAASNSPQLICLSESRMLIALLIAAVHDGVPSDLYWLLLEANMWAVSEEGSSTYLLPDSPMGSLVVSYFVSAIKPCDIFFHAVFPLSADFPSLCDILSVREKLSQMGFETWRQKCNAPMRNSTWEHKVMLGRIIESVQLFGPNSTGWTSRVFCSLLLPACVHAKLMLSLSLRKFT